MISPRERAARAVCRLDGKPEDVPYKGYPMWRKYLLEVDTVLQAALQHPEWVAIKLKGPFLRSPDAGGTDEITARTSR